MEHEDVAICGEIGHGYYDPAKGCLDCRVREQEQAARRFNDEQRARARLSIQVHPDSEYQL